MKAVSKKAIKRRVSILVVFTFVFVFSGCQKNYYNADANDSSIHKNTENAVENLEGSSTINLILENIKGSLIHMDKRFALYEDALASIHKYVSNPTKKTLANAKKICINNIAEIVELSMPISNLHEETKNEFAILGINMADYNVPFYNIEYYKNENIQSLTVLLLYLNNAPDHDETLKFIMEFYSKYQEFDRKTNYLALNDVFCKCKGKEIEDFKNNFLTSLEVFSSDKLPWENDADVIEAKINKLFDDIEGDINDYSIFVGKKQLNLLKIQRQLKDDLMSQGYSEDEADKIIVEKERLSDLISGQ